MAAAARLAGGGRPRLLRRLRSNRDLLFAFSAAAQQSSTGDDCGPDDPCDEQRYPIDKSTSEYKTMKLEEQVRDLTALFSDAPQLQALIEADRQFSHT